MAALWQTLRNEFRASVDDIKSKGVAGAFYDAALDAKDLLVDAGGAVVGGAQAVLGGSTEERPALRRPAPGASPEPGSLAVLELEDGTTEEVVVLALDGISDPPRVRVKRENGEDLVAPLMDFDEAQAADGLRSIAASGMAGGQWLLDELSKEVRGTVEDFREKGAVGALKDATLDAFDIVGDAASKARDVAQPLASSAYAAAQPLASTAYEAAQPLASTAYEAAQPLAATAYEAAQPLASTALEGAKSLAKRGGLIDDAPVPAEGLEDPFAIGPEDQQDVAGPLKSVPKLQLGANGGDSAEVFSIATARGDARGDAPSLPQFRGQQTTEATAETSPPSDTSSDSEDEGKKAQEEEELID